MKDVNLQILRAAVRSLRIYSGVLILVGGLAILYTFISIRFWSVVGPMIGVSIGAFFAVCWFVYDRNRDSMFRSKNDSSQIRVQIPVIITCTYISSIIIGLQYTTYRRPAWLYLVFALYSMFIAYQIARGTNHKRVIPQIAILAFFTYWSSQLLFPTGMYNIDTHIKYVPAISEIYSSGMIPQRLRIYMGHIAHATVFTWIIGKQPQMGYYLLSTLLLICTIPVISIINNVMPAVSRGMAQYAALIFAISSWMLRRGMHPNKLNFFYALILLLGLITIRLHRSSTESATWRWAVIGFVSMPAIIFGHQFSAGAAMVFLSAIVGFAFLAKTSVFGYERISRGHIFPFVVVYVLAIMGNPLHQSSLLGRISALMLSLFETSTTGGPGRYSEIIVEVLVFSTLAQTILFAIAIFGAIWMFRQERWEFDLVIFWLGVLSVLLIISLLRNSADIQPQRFYAYLVLFGFNLCAGVSLHLLDNRAVLNWRNHSIYGGRVLVVLLVASLALAGLASPIADEVTSPVGGEIPHNQKFETKQQIAGSLWSERYTTERLYVSPDSYPRPQIQQIGQSTGIVNLTDFETSTVIVYSNLSNRTGLVVSSELSLGGRNFVFVKSPEEPRDDRIYSNGEMIAFQLNRNHDTHADNRENIHDSFRRFT